MAHRWLSVHLSSVNCHQAKNLVACNVCQKCPVSSCLPHSQCGHSHLPHATLECCKLGKLLPWPALVLFLTWQLWPCSLGLLNCHGGLVTDCFHRESEHGENSQPISLRKPLHPCISHHRAPSPTSTQSPTLTGPALRKGVLTSGATPCDPCSQLGMQAAGQG